jgi:hypothetical protein
MADPTLDIRCTIIHLSLNNRNNTDRVLEPQPFSQPELDQSYQGANTNGYAALSYVWESSEPAQTVYVKDVSRKVTPYLAGALRHFRHSKSYRWLWVDALCIDQSNKEEVEQQVGMMGHVYKKAS